ncbi:hypothetical protein SRHO_G00176520 [Serrasalmus rhombeus]
MGRPFPLPWRQKTAPGGTADVDVRRSEYTAGLLTVLNEYWERVNQTITDPPKVPTHAFKPGDQMPHGKGLRAGLRDATPAAPYTSLSSPAPTICMCALTHHSNLPCYAPPVGEA